MRAQLVGAEVEDVYGLGCDALRFWTCGDGMSSVSTGRVGSLRTEFGGGLCGLAFEARVEEFDFDVETLEEMGVGGALRSERRAMSFEL